MSRLTQTQAATTDPIAWSVYVVDDFNVPRIDLVFDAAPVTAGLITVTKDSGAGAAYDAVIRTINPVGQTAVIIEGLHGFVSGDKLLIEYANADGVSIIGTAAIEFIDYTGDLAAGKMTVSDGTVRSLSAKYAHYYHLPMTSLAPGASGATYTIGTANNLSGWLLDAAAEYVLGSTDVHSSWDSSINPVFEMSFTNMIDNSGGAVGDVLKLTVTVRCKSVTNQTIREQVLTPSLVVGAMAQYAMGKFEIELPRDAANNPIQAGDIMTVKVQLHIDSDVTAILVNDASIEFPTSHVGIEWADV